MTKTQTAKRAKGEEGIVQTATAKERGDWLRKVLTRKLNKVFLFSYHFFILQDENQDEDEDTNKDKEREEDHLDTVGDKEVSF